MPYRERRGRLGTAVQPTMQQFTIPASTGGMNALDNLMQMPPEDCIYCQNIMPSEYGLRLREGYRQWAINIPGSVNTIIPFEGQETDASADRLFAVTPLGIYNITQFADNAPPQEVAFTNNIVEAGYGVWTEFTNDATSRFLYYADSLNGLHQYEEDTGLWTVPSFTGPAFDVTLVAYVTTWKNRMWFIQQESGDAYYTDLDAVGGTVVPFTFGSKFKHGGELKSLYSWTLDGGDGIDDLLVAISRGGDVLVYSGFDPALSPEAGGLSLVGSFFLGEVPESRRLGVNYGGELYIISTYGITSLRDLVQGVVPSEPAASPSAKISRPLRQAVQDGKDDLNWSLQIFPGDGFLQVVTPYVEEKDALQYNQNLLTRAWGRWEGVPANCAETWNAQYYIGTKEGIVHIYNGQLDGTTIDDINVWTDVAAGIVPPEWSQPVADEYACDGTQANQTAYQVDTVEDIINTVVYEVQYTITNFVAGNHAINIGNSQATSAFNTGNGTFTTTVRATSAGLLASVVGDIDFVGTFSLVDVHVQAQLGSAIDFELLSSFQAPNGDISNFKRVGFIRTIGVIAGTANINVGAIYDYAIEETLISPPTVADQGFNVWDSGVWDTDLWDFSQKGVSFPLGSMGIGRTVAVAMRGNSNTRLNIIGWDISYTQGGFL